MFKLNIQSQILVTCGNMMLMKIKLQNSSHIPVVKYTAVTLVLRSFTNSFQNSNARYLRFDQVIVILNFKLGWELWRIPNCLLRKFVFDFQISLDATPGKKKHNFEFDNGVE